MRMAPLVNLPYSSGPISFVKAPIVEDIKLLPDTAKVAVIGVPFDEGTTNRPGARFGPRMIREASSVYGFTPGCFDGFYDIELEQERLKGNIIIDVGDCLIAPTESGLTRDSITYKVSEIVSANLFPVCLGGDHSVTFPIINAISKFTKVNILQLDTHIDFMDEVSGAKYSHGSPIKRISELANIGNIYQVGVRGFLNSIDSHKKAITNGNTIISVSRFREIGCDRLIKILSSGNYYVTIDIDVFDPSIAPGTGTPEPGGLNYEEVKRLLTTVTLRNDIKIIGFDIVEVNPYFDQSGITSLLASRIILDLLGLIFK